MAEIQALSEVMTLEEMKVRYAPDWVLIVDLDVDPSLEIRSGRVAFHSLDRDEVYRKAIELKPGYFGFRCFAEPDPEMVFVL